ncbi:DUF4307 domain-containing protein [Gephyromycinifex aptenodytis]|uniref:DUF4307 domain-containing protein n=1 Tax=Gephyromycinifex aptenodytis TaxID=2716227 RepID=UPI001448205E|nr:DUF4307 domain-containing protein [Gephyromycinifex aptenodytis]
MALLNTFRSLPPARRRMWVFGTLAILGGIGIVVWFVLAASIGKPLWGDLAYDVKDARTVIVKYQLTRPTDRTVVCLVEAKEVNHGTVGRVEDVIPPGPQARVVRTVAVRTTSEAVIGQVRTCRAQ